MAQTWPVPGGSASGGGGDGYPDDAATFGTVTVDDEEFDDDLSAWTVETDLTAPNAREVDGTFSPSRLRVSFANTTGIALNLTKALDAATYAGNISITWDVSGVFNTNFRNIQVGVVDSATLAGADAMVGVVAHVAADGGFTIRRRKYTNVGSSTFTDATIVALGDVDEPRRLFLHLQRVSNSWSLWYSTDAVTWYRTGTPATDSFAFTHALVMFGGSSTLPQPVSLAINWIRFNRFFL